MPLTNMLNLALILALTLAQGSYVPALNSKVMSRARRIGDNFRRLSPDTVLFVDGDNVRGKTGFAVSKEKLIDDLFVDSAYHSSLGPLSGRPSSEGEEQPLRQQAVPRTWRCSRS